MSRTKKGGKAPGFEYWSRRPGNKWGSIWIGKLIKKATHRAERRANNRPEAVKDDTAAVYAEIDRRERLDELNDAVLGGYV